MRIIILATLLFLNKSGFSQQGQDTLIDFHFHQAEELTSDSLYNEAIIAYDKILKSYSLDAETWERIKLNQGYLYINLGKNNKAKACFKSVLTKSEIRKNKNEKGLSTTEFQPAHKYFAACNLAYIALQEKKYNEALLYIKMFDKKYAYTSYCGSENIQNYYYKYQMYASAYAGLGDTLKALKLLIPHIFNIDNYDLVSVATKILKTKYTKATLIKDFENAIENLKYDKTKINDPNNKYFFHYLGFIIEVPHYIESDISEDYESLPQDQYLKKALKKSYFYSKLIE